MLRLRALAPIGLLLLLADCSSVLTQGAGAGAGIAAAGVSHAITRNGAVTAGIALGAQAVAIAGVQYLEKDVHGTEQNAIAAAAGPVAVGAVAPWSVSHDIPIERNRHGELTVVREIAPPLPTGGAAAAFDCKEIIFSVDTVKNHQPDRNFYTTDVCADNGRWKWAEAEPATQRWGALQ